MSESKESVEMTSIKTDKKEDIETGGVKRDVPQTQVEVPLDFSSLMVVYLSVVRIFYSEFTLTSLQYNL